MKPDIDILIVQLRDGRPATRAEAARTLAEFPSSLAKSDLVRCLRDQHDNVRYWATWAVAALGTGDAMDLVAAQLEDPDGGVRMIAAKALAQHPHQRAAVQLLRVLDDGSDNVCYWASAALEALGPHVVAKLIGALGDASWRRRSGAARTLVRVGPAVLEPVAAALRRDDPNTQYWALFVLGELRDRRAAPLVVPFLASPSRDLVLRAAASLGQLGCREAIPRLVALLAHADEQVRLAAIEALAGFGDYSVKVLTDLLASNRRVMKVSATMSLSMVGDTALRGILEKLREESGELRFWAIRALERFDNPAIVPVLVDLLDDEEFSIQLAAAAALQSYRLPPSVAASLVPRMANPNWRVRRALAESLAAQKHLDPALFAEGIASPDEDLRYWTAWVLGQVGGEGAARLLIQRFDDPSWPIRKRAAESIAQVGAPAAPVLAELLARPDADPNARYWASRALIGIDDQGLIPQLVAMLEDADWSIRKNAEEALLRMGRAAVPSLLTALRTRPSRVVRENVSRCLVQVKDLDAEAVATLLQFRDPDLNYWTTWVLGQRGRTSLPCLERLLRQGEERARSLALRAMAAIDDPVVHRCAQELLEDEYVSLRRQAAEILGRFKVAAAVPALLKAAAGAPEELKVVVVRALGDVGDERALPLLLACLDDTRWDIRKEAVTALGRLRRPEAVDRLVELLADGPSGDLRPFVAQALGELRDRRAYAPLADLLARAGDDEELALAAVEALGRLGDPAAFAALAPYVEAGSWDLRRAALEALGALDTLPDLAVVKAAVGCDDAVLRATAQKVLRKVMGEERWSDYVQLTVRRALLEPAEEHHRSALELRAAGDVEGAAKEARAALRCAPRAPTYLLLGSLHLEAKRLDLARANLRKALKLAPADPAVLSKLAAADLMAGRPKEAAKLFERMLAQPGLPEGLRELASRTLERIRALGPAGRR